MFRTNKIIILSLVILITFVSIYLSINIFIYKDLKNKKTNELTNLLIKKHEKLKYLIEENPSINLSNPIYEPIVKLWDKD